MLLLIHLWFKIRLKNCATFYHYTSSVMGSIKLINELRFGGVGATRDEGDGEKSAKILKLLQKKLNCTSRVRE